jgi:hypothetical protein
LIFDYEYFRKFESKIESFQQQLDPDPSIIKQK